MQWSFPACKNGEQKGISDSGVETFAGTPLSSLAREICQNSLDAALSAEKPVKVTFKTLEIRTDTLPDYEKLIEIFKKGRSYWPDDQKARDFFEAALEVLARDTITILRISDHNTTGLTGSSKETGSPWCNLIKSSGASNKGDGSGGSYGIGKFATFACSALRTVFYSTLDSEGVEASQGVCRITSFIDDNGDTATGVGYCGATDNKPMSTQWTVGSNRENGDFGTDIIIPGFICSGEDWKDTIIESVLEGFLDAVYRAALIVDVDGREITKATLSSFFESGKKYPERAEVYYEILTSPETKWYTEDNFLDLGKVALGLMIKQGFHQRVAMIRKTGMKIMDRGHMSSTIPCAGVFRIDGVPINDILRLMENPQHVKWEPERLGKNKNKGTAVRDALFRYPRERLKELLGSSDTKEIDSEIGEYLPAPPTEDAGSKRNQAETLSTTIKAVIPRQAPRTTVHEGAVSNESDVEEDIRLTDGNDGVEFDSGGGNNDGGSASNGGGIGDETGEGIGGSPRNVKTRKERVALSKVRFFCRDKDDGVYSLVMTPADSISNGSIEVFVAAETQHYKAEIISATMEDGATCTVSENSITGIALQKGRPAKFNLTLNYRDYCSLEVMVYVHK